MLFIRRERFKEYMAKYPLTSAILAVNIVYFALMRLFPSVNENVTIFYWGAYFKPAIQNGELYRLVTPIFMQFEPAHLIFNLYSIFLFAAVLERLIGRGKFLLLYMIAGIGGFISTYLFSSTQLELGASGAVFGVLGAFLYLMYKKSSLLDKGSKTTIAVLLVMNLLLTFIAPNISITGHLGGLAVGFATAWFMKIEQIR